MRYRGWAIALVLVLSLAVVAADAGGAGTPPLPPLPPVPPLPKPPKVKGQRTAKFNVIVEGEITADRQASLGGTTGGCDAQVTDDISEHTTFGRGKGVVFQIAEIKKGKQREYLLNQVKPRTGAFTAVGTVDRHASGVAELLQHPNSLPCPAAKYDLGKNPDCQKPKVDRENWGLRLQGNHFAPGPINQTLVSASSCGAPPPNTPFSTAMADITYGWPDGVPLGMEPLPLKKIFNTRYHAFKVDFKSIHALAQTGSPDPALQGSATDHGYETATVRFIRIR